MPAPTGENRGGEKPKRRSCLEDVQDGSKEACVERPGRMSLMPTSGAAALLERAHAVGGGAMSDGSMKLVDQQQRKGEGALSRDVSPPPDPIRHLSVEVESPEFGEIACSLDHYAKMISHEADESGAAFHGLPSEPSPSDNQSERSQGRSFGNARFTIPQNHNELSPLELTSSMRGRTQIHV